MPRYYPSGPNHRHGGGSNNNPRSGGGGGSSDIPTNINVVATTADHQQDPSTTNNNAYQTSLTLARLRQKAISHPMQQCQLTIYVPPHTVGAIIGRGGRTILNVQREAMRRSAGHVAPVRISVLGGSSGSGGNSNAPATVDNQGTESYSAASSQGGNNQASNTTWNYQEYYHGHQHNGENRQDSTDGDDTEDEEEEDWTPVIIRGDPVGCFSAVRQILPLVDRDHDPDIVFEVPIHRAKHNTLVGKGGVTLAALSATYETRIMIPPNEFMSNVSGIGGGNFWQKRQEHNMNTTSTSSSVDAGSTMLFGDNSNIASSTSGGGSNHQHGGSGAKASLNSNSPSAAAGTLPPNIIQLEGDIDKIEQCLVKMLSIVSGERWVPSGVIVEKEETTPSTASSGNKKNATASSSFGGTKSTTTTTSPTAASAGGTTTSSKGGKQDKDETTAEAVIVKIWTPSSKLLNLGKIRKVQRKTNTVIRRKKLRFNSNYNNDGSGAVVASTTEKEEDLEEEPGLVNEDNEEEEGGSRDVAGPKTATKYIITGRTESVKSAAAQFEKILGLEPGSSKIIDTTHKTNAMIADNSNSNKDVPNAQQTGPNNIKVDGESESGTPGTGTGGGGGGPPGKKIRRKKKRGKPPNKGGPKEANAAQSPSVGDT